MKPTRNNRIVVDLGKVQYAVLQYVNQYGQRADRHIAFPSVRMDYASDTLLAYPHPDYPGETELKRATRLGILDAWTPELILKLQANGCLVYTGDKALSIWKEWNSRIFGKKKT